MKRDITAKDLEDLFADAGRYRKLCEYAEWPEAVEAAIDCGSKPLIDAAIDAWEPASNEKPDDRGHDNVMTIDDLMGLMWDAVDWIDLHEPAARTEIRRRLEEVTGTDWPNRNWEPEDPSAFKVPAGGVSAPRLVLDESGGVAGVTHVYSDRSDGRCIHFRWGNPSLERCRLTANHEGPHDYVPAFTQAPTEEASLHEVIERLWREVNSCPTCRGHGSHPVYLHDATTQQVCPTCWHLRRDLRDLLHEAPNFQVRMPGV